MVEKHHVKTVPGEHVAPEHVSHPLRPEPGGHVQQDDINVALVALIGGFFAILLLVTILGLEAWFYDRSAAELQRKTAPQGSPGTELYQARAEWERYLAGGEVPDPADPSKKVRVEPIDKAMDTIVQQASARGAGGNAGGPGPHRE